MGDTVLLLGSRDLCYESNQYFMRCIADALLEQGRPVEFCDVTAQMEEKLLDILMRQESFLAAFDFNSLLPRLELEDGTPFLQAFRTPFFNYLVDHPLYHHPALTGKFFNYSVICIDKCHQAYVKAHYPNVKHVYYLPLGGMQAGMARPFSEKRLDLLFLGTYGDEGRWLEELRSYPCEKRREVSALIEMMEADPDLTQEGALLAYLDREGEAFGAEAFAERLNGDFLADKYLRDHRRKEALLAAAKAKVPMTVIGHGWEKVSGLRQAHVSIQKGIGFAASLQMMANARMLLDTAPGFHGGLHDRVYSAMLNRTLCFTEGTQFARQALWDGREAALYDWRDLDALAGRIAYYHEQRGRAREIVERAYEAAANRDAWEHRALELMSWLSRDP